ncbi:MAG: hypothetical protein FKGGLIKP_00055 [Sodalis sp. Fse]|nr:MAG: hypothetical protein FKGGLIKP_00055 [Sodalis sp. Fse]
MLCGIVRHMVLALSTAFFLIMYFDFPCVFISVSLASIVSMSNIVTC